MTPIRFKVWSKVVQIIRGNYQIGRIVYDDKNWWQFRMADGRIGSKHSTWREAANECESIYN